MTVLSSMHDEISAYCAKIGAAPLLVQGAGGNVSWKDGNTLWVKASGTWLADAAEKNIFVPVNLDHMTSAVNQLNFDTAPQVLGDATLRPSIETMLHALMPHPIVVHLHPIEIIAWLVREDAPQQISARLANSTKWGLVEYAKPGEQLARAVHHALENRDINILFLLNHGIVIGGDNVSQIHDQLTELVQLFKLEPKPAIAQSILPSFTWGEDVYLPISDINIQQLVFDPDLYEGISNRWAICPDHVVFLGASPTLYSSRAELFNNAPPGDAQIIFIKDEGVFSRGELNRAKQLQLRCYYDVMCRLSPTSKVSTLTNLQIAELLNWDAERYRMSIAK